MQLQDVVDAWDQADPKAIHPTRALSEDAYWSSGMIQAQAIASVMPKRGRIIDFGSGDGRVGIPLRELGFNVVCVDSSPTHLDKVPAPTLVSDGTNLIHALDRPAAGLFALAVLIHHDYASGKAIVGHLVNAVRPGGILVLDWPTSEAPVERKAWIEVTTWDEVKRERLAKDLGLERLDSELPWPVYRKTKAPAFV